MRARQVPRPFFYPQQIRDRLNVSGDPIPMERPTPRPNRWGTGSHSGRKFALISHRRRWKSMSATTRARQPQPEETSTHERIRRRAQEIYIERGSQPGFELDDWLRAEAEIRQAQDRA